ncbi:hypothetical protein [Salinispira pacifica]|uniref:hypothetical protein n=1 Tax=Salinispira pacifica TaxID=1307761 RepID=UPI00059B8378|nr:hypothetical protein [Salinispira pacifica]
MKKSIIVAGIILLTGMILVSCATTSSASSSAPKKSVDPNTIIGMNLIGTGESEGEAISFKADGVLEITTSDGSFTGEWEYNPDPEMAFRPIVIKWNQDGELHGYISILRTADNQSYTLLGNWYPTDANKTMVKDYVVE